MQNKKKKNQINFSFGDKWNHELQLHFRTLWKQQSCFCFYFLIVLYLVILYSTLKWNKNFVQTKKMSFSTYSQFVLFYIWCTYTNTNVEERIYEEYDKCKISSQFHWTQPYLPIEHTHTFMQTPNYFILYTSRTIVFFHFVHIATILINVHTKRTDLRPKERGKFTYIERIIVDQAHYVIFFLFDVNITVVNKRRKNRHEKRLEWDENEKKNMKELIIYRNYKKSARSTLNVIGMNFSLRCVCAMHGENVEKGSTLSMCMAVYGVCEGDGEHFWVVYCFKGNANVCDWQSLTAAF